jgi:hypothetical protein
MAGQQKPVILLSGAERAGRTGFNEGFFRRVQPAGAHPGLSDEGDSTFRLHPVLLVFRTF